MRGDQTLLSEIKDNERAYVALEKRNTGTGMRNALWPAQRAVSKRSVAEGLICSANPRYIRI